MNETESVERSTESSGSAIPNMAYAHLFAIPWAAHHWPANDALNRDLKSRIVAEAKRNHGERRSNLGGWHSPSGSLEFLGEPGAALKRQMHELVSAATRRVLAESGKVMPEIRWSFVGWANVCGAGDSHAGHTHPGATWSGVYYVDPGDAGHGEGGQLELTDPCLGRANTFLPHLLPSCIRVQPRAGLMVLFPSFLSHAVLPHGGAGTRISIAFNFRKEPYP